MSDFWHYVAILGLYSFPALSLVAAFSDLLRYQIPNWIPALMLALFFPLSLGLGWPLSDIGMSVLCFLAVLVLSFILFIFKLFGGGDAKLIAASSIWIGWQLLPSFILLIALFGGVLAVVILILRKVNLPEKMSKIGWVGRLCDLKNGIPYGLAIAAASLVLFPGIRLFKTIF